MLAPDFTIPSVGYSLGDVPERAIVTTGIVYGYVRESNGDDLDPEGQMRDCRALAVRYGFDPAAIEFVSDWGQSGRRIDRPGYQRIRAAIEAGQVAAVLARSVDRLGRDAQEVMAFEALALTHGSRVLTDRDGERTVDPDSVNTIVRWLPALMAQEESRLGRDRARRGRTTRLDNIEAHRAACSEGPMCTDTSHWDGLPPATPERRAMLAAAFAEAGTYTGAVRLMNGRGHRIEATTATRILRWMDANRLLDMPLPRGRRVRGQRPRAVHALSGLVRCPHDGTPLTASWWGEQAGPRNNRRTVPMVRLFCREGRKHADHPRPYQVKQRVVLDWLMAASASVLGAQFRFEVVTEDVTEVIASMQEQLRRVGVAYRGGSMDDTEFEFESTRIRADLARIEGANEARTAFDMGIDWSLEPAALNARLRDVLYAVHLDATFRPTAVVWTRQPMVEDESGFAIPDERALPYEAGWRLPFTRSDG